MLLILISATPTIQAGLLPVQELFNTGVAAYKKGDLATARTLFLTGLEQQPNNPTLLYATGFINRKSGAIPASIYYYEKALENQPNHVDAAFGLAQSYHAVGNVKHCWQLFNRWRKDKLAHYPQEPSQLCNKHVLIRAEWGLGDMMHYIRYALKIKRLGCHVTVEAARPITQLLNNCWYIDHVIPKGHMLPPYDYEIPLLYLPTLFKTSLETIPAEVPYLYPNNDLVQKWQPLFERDHATKIGICWDMGHHDTNLPGWQRAAPLENWLPLFETPGLSFYCLQKESCDPLKKLPAHISVYQFDPTFDVQHGGFMDTAAAMQHLDLVITVDTAIAHLAGGLGIPVWVLLPNNPDYRWMLEGSKTPWYPTMKLFRQKSAGDWQPVIAEIKQELHKLVHNATQDLQHNNQK